MGLLSVLSSSNSPFKPNAVGRFSKESRRRRLQHVVREAHQFSFVTTTHSMVYKGQRENLPRGVPNNYPKYT